MGGIWVKMRVGGEGELAYKRSKRVARGVIHRSEEK
jgi:hypothetical protein